MAYSFNIPSRTPAEVHALLAANRLEARPRSPEFNRALRAEIRDPTWLLARQWQLREFRAEDRGTPAYAEIAMRELPLSRLALPGQAPRDYAAGRQPLEAAVEAQPRPLGAGLRLQMGQYWLRQLRALPELIPTSDDNRAAVGTFAQVFPLVAPEAALDPVAYAQQRSTPEVLALLALAGTSAVDGYALYEALLAPYAQNAAVQAALADSAQLAIALQSEPLAQQLLATPPFTGQAAPLLAAGLDRLQAVGGSVLDGPARQFVLAMHRLYLLGAESTSWSTEAMAYRFAVGTAGEAGLGAADYFGGASLPWYAVDQQAAPAGSPPAPSLSPARRLLPTEVQFPGAPASRWWEFEDRRVDFGQLTGDPSDWGRMLLQEFIFLYQNDWFSVPYSVAAGTVCGVEELQVVDVFGLRYAIQPAGAGQRSEKDSDQLIDNDEHRWRLFAQTDATEHGPATKPRLYVPAVVLAPLVSSPLEQVGFRREEATNLVWAVESIIPDGFAGGINGATAAGQVSEALRHMVPTPPATAGISSAATYTYQLASSVPENWVPFVPARTPAGATVLEQGVYERQIPGLVLAESNAYVQPRTSLLQLRSDAPYFLHEHEVPPAGLRVEGNCYRARWFGGRTVLWFGRHRGPALLAGSSGLAFDQLKPGDFS